MPGDKHFNRHQRSYRKMAEQKARAAQRDESQRFGPGYNPRLGARCLATTVMFPDSPTWSPEAPDTVVTATCDQAGSHRGWHVSPDGYSWDPEDDGNYVHFPAPPT